MKKVIVADDHPLVREGIKKVLDKAVDFKITAEAENGKQLLNLLRDKAPDIVICDITMPGRSGLELLKDLSEWYPNIPVLMLSIHPEERMALRAFKAGAWGYLNKSSITEKLVKALRKITIQKRKYINPEVAEQLALHIDEDQEGSPHDSLSSREFEIMCHIATGDSVQEIAEELSLSPQTIYTYRTRVKEKMGLDSNVEITRYALENDLIEKE